MEAEKNRGSSGTVQSLMQESAQTSATPEIDARIDAQKRNLDSLLQRYTEQHPDIISARKLIKDLEEQKRKEAAELQKAALNSPSSRGSSSLLHQEMSRMLAVQEVQVAQLKARVREYEGRYAAALASMKTAPQLEAEAAQLNRDYAIHKKNYEDLVARRESASISGELDVASGVADFRLIDPPRVAPQPVAPNRLMLLAAAMAAAIGAGVFASFAASQLRPVFFDTNELRNKTELPVLGVVSRMVSEEDLRREKRDKIRFWIGSAVLVLAYIIGLGVMAVLNNQGAA